MFKRLDDEYGDLSVASSVVILGDGFFASAIRSLVMAIGAVRPQTSHRKIHASVDEVARWLPELHRAKTGVELPADELLRVLQQAQETPRS